MKLPNSRNHAARPSFTLVELLVVIAIIIVLVSLLMVGVFKALDSAYQAQTRTDITQIAAALESFKTKYQVSYVPSRIILCENPANYFVGGNPANGYWTPLHQDSLDYLQQVFPRIGSPTLATSQWATTGIDWNGDMAIADPPMSLSVYPAGTVTCNGWLLEGEQCLVFFTGGIPSPATNTVTGFSTNQSNPAALTGDRVAPFFDFKSNRLSVIFGTFPPGLTGFPSYMDGYGKTPYAFFSSYKNQNGYNRYVYISNPYLPLVGSGAPVTSDCQALSQYGANGLPPFPYAQSGMFLAPQASNPGNVNPVYLNPGTYQIISAGKDNIFGNGTVIAGYPPLTTNPPYLGGSIGGPAGNQVWVSTALWTPSNASGFYLPGTPGGADDIANFYDRLLGVPTQ